MDALAVTGEGGGLRFESPAQDWQGQFVAPLLGWYAQRARVLPWRSDPTPYRVWVSEIMLQQTRVQPALPYFERFVAELPDERALAAAPEDRLVKLWEGLGYYSRVRNMQKAAKELVRLGGFPRTLEGLIALPGVGRYTAGAILSIAYNIPAPAVDGNVLRVLSRVALYREDVTRPLARALFEGAVLHMIPKGRARDFSQALMELGALVCRPVGEPLCRECPVAGACSARLAGCAARLPQKPPKKPRPRQQRTVLLVACGGRVLLRRRPAGGLLGGMWEFPGAEGHLCGEEAVAMAHALTGGEVLDFEPLPAAVHIFTHREWHMRAWLVRVRGGPAQGPPGPPAGCVWATPFEVREGYALPSAFKAWTGLLPQLLL